ncbi:hypothetical protein [Portibacter marinus]|uniref:hypothetical protein n=1 Tax=Portibacter marinus TaxID=2898660 RepID=UPI001F1D2BEF|nr:hypothetical protein [Portibacter marinus]
MDKHLSILRPLLDDLPDHIFPKIYQSKIAEIASLLPPLEHGIIEFTERPYSQRVDLMICWFYSEAKSKGFVPMLDPFPEFKGLVEFLAHWKDEAKFLSSMIENIYLVFDLVDIEAPFVEPWMYLAFKRLYLPPDIILDLFIKSASFLPHQIPGPSIPILLNILERTRDPYWVFGFGLLHQRGEQLLRIGIADFQNIESIAHFLAECDWQGNSDKLKAHLIFIESFTNNFVLSLKISDHIETEIGIECILSKMNNYSAARILIDYLVKHKFFNHHRAQAILKILIPDQLVPKVPFRWLNHIKFNFDGEKMVAVKPYLYYEKH